MTTLEENIELAKSQFKTYQCPQLSTSGPSPTELADFIDHTNLKPEAKEADILNLCREALEYNFKTICINSSWLPLCVEILGRTPGPVPIVVVGFPLGACTTEIKAFEAKNAISHGAKEIDMVIHVGRLKSRDYKYVYQDIKAVYEACGSIPLKVILETCLLTTEEIIAACVICREIGTAFVKTSTGFGGAGATATHVALMKAVVGENIQVKASGGIRTYEDAVKMYNAGARRIGASSSVSIVTKKV